MITTSINITPYLAEYLRGKFNDGADDPFRIPNNTDLYYLVWQLMSRRPSGLSPVDTGNITFILPDRRVGKDPQVYNYLSPHSARMIDAEIRRMFNHELHATMLDNQQHFSDLNNLDIAHRFLCTYGIETLSEDALLKNFYRYRENIRKRKKRREYKKKLKSN